MLLKFFDAYEKEAWRLMDLGLVHPAYDYILNAAIPLIFWMPERLSRLLKGPDM